MSHGSKSISLSEVVLPQGSIVKKLSMASGVVGAAALAGLFILGKQNAHQMYFSYLVAYMYFLSLALGGLFFVLVQFATKAGWSVVVRRFAENAMVTLPFFAVLFLPIIFGLHDLMHWTHADVVENDPILSWKKPYLNVPFFLMRAGIFFVIWTIFSQYFFRSSRRQDVTGDQNITRRLQTLSYPGIALFGITITFAAVDWMMSLDPHWFSTIFGVYFFAGSTVATFAFLSVVAVMLRRVGGMSHIVSVEHLHDLGKLTFAFTVFWTYIAFSQYFLIWYGNIPEETIWFAHRMEGGWKDVSMFLMLGHFVIPFFFLLPRTIKRTPALLALGALWMLVVHFVDLYWVIMPIHSQHDPHFGALDILAIVGVGGMFLALFLAAVASGALIPVKDPRLPESLGFENF